MARLGFFEIPTTDASRVTTPDHADFAPPSTTVAWSIRGEFLANGLSENQTILSQWTSGQQAFVLAHSHAGLGSIRLYWSTTGSDNPSITNTGGNAPIVAGDRFQIRVDFYQDNGASEYEADFYYKINSFDDLDSDTGWTQLGTTVVGSTGTTTVHNSTGEVAVGRYNTGGGDPNEINVYQVCIKQATTTKMYADFRSGIWEATGDDEQGHTWTPQTNADHIPPVVGGHPSKAVKPGRWSVTPSMVAPEWRSIWRDLEVVIPFWNTGLAVEISNQPGPLSLAGGQSPTTEPSPLGLQHTFGTGSAGGYLTNADVPGFPDSDVTYVGINQVDDLATDEESVIRIDDTTNNSYLRIELDGRLHWNHTTVIDCYSPTGWLSAGDQFLWLIRQRTKTFGHDLYGYNFTTGVAFSDTDLPNTDEIAATRAELGYRAANDYGSCMSVFYAWDRAITDAEWRALVRDPFGPIRMDLAGPEVSSQVPIYKDHYTGSKDVSSTTCEVDWSSTTVAAGDLMVVHIVGDQANAVTEPSGVPSGWAKIANETAGTAYCYSAWWKVATAADVSAGTATWTHDAGSQDFGYSVVVIKAGTFAVPYPFDSFASDEDKVPNGVITQAITTRGPNRLLLFLAGSDGDAAGETFSSNLGAEQYDDNDLTGDLLHVAGYTHTAALAGTYTPTVTLSVANEMDLQLLSIMPLGGSYSNTAAAPFLAVGRHAGPLVRSGAWR